MESNVQPTPAVIVPDAIPGAGLPSFIQMEQKKASDAAAVELTGGDPKDTKDKKGKKDDLTGLMPKWMYALGETYSEQDKMNSYNGVVGKYLAQIAKTQLLQQSFAKLISSADSFGGLQYFIEMNPQFASQVGGVGSTDTALINEFEHWSPQSDDLEAQEQGELASMQQQGEFLNQHSQLGQSLTKRMQNSAKELNDDGTQIGQLVSQFELQFLNGMH